jgi:ATP-dependent Clp protease ATP-binding subunit ClpA
VKKHFTPEFRNRLDAIIEFNKLSKEQVKPIAMKFIDDLNELLEPRGIEVRVAEPALDQLVTDGFDEKMGARPMKRIIAEKIKKPLSKKIVFNNLMGCTVMVNYNGVDYDIEQIS